MNLGFTVSWVVVRTTVFQGWLPWGSLWLQVSGWDPCDRALGRQHVCLNSAMSSDGQVARLPLGALLPLVQLGCYLAA